MSLTHNNLLQQETVKYALTLILDKNNRSAIPWFACRQTGDCWCYSVTAKLKQAYNEQHVIGSTIHKVKRAVTLGLFPETISCHVLIDRHNGILPYKISLLLFFEHVHLFLHLLCKTYYRLEFEEVLICCSEMLLHKKSYSKAVISELPTVQFTEKGGKERKVAVILQDILERSDAQQKGINVSGKRHLAMGRVTDNSQRENRAWKKDRKTLPDMIQGIKGKEESWAVKCALT